MEENTETTQDIPQETPVVSTANPVIIGGVTVNESITNKHVLASQGIVEYQNTDGSFSQMKVEDAQAEVSKLESIKSELEAQNGSN
ncbi:MAG: hypothetical protein ACRDFB_07185 [Rhabdochlamydiaceae bacterium]